MIRVNGADGISDIEGKTTRVGASEYGQRTSFNRIRQAGHLDEIQGVVANTLSLFRNRASLLANAFGVGFIVPLEPSLHPFLSGPILITDVKKRVIKVRLEAQHCNDLLV